MEERKGKNIMARKMAKKIPINDCSKTCRALDWGKKSINSFEPSSGGMGIRLNKPRKILI